MLIVQFLFSSVISALSGMGVGGGGLFVIYLSLMTDTPQLVAQGQNLLFFLFSAGSSMLVHLQKRRLFPPLILLMSLCGVAGALLGAGLSLHVSGSLLRKLFGGMLIAGGIVTLQKKDTSSSALPRD